jgi:drug/metabolite transporter (DMT)-like permease
LEFNPKESTMRVSLIAGAILLAAGLYIVIRGVNYSREESVFKLGDIEAKVQQQHAVPEWIGGVALGAGAVLLIAGLRKR